MSINNSNGVIGNRTRNPPACSCATAHRTRRHPYLSHLTCSCVLNIKAECFSILCEQLRLYLCALCGSKKEQRLFILKTSNLLILVTITSGVIPIILEYCTMSIGKELRAFRKDVVPLSARSTTLLQRRTQMGGRGGWLPDCIFPQIGVKESQIL